jgi:hypothetical protein
VIALPISGPGAARLLGLLGLGVAASAARAQPPPPAPPGIVKPLQECPRRASGDIVVCGRSEAISPYRLPRLYEGFDPDGPIDSVSRERHRLFEVGEAGIGSCSAAGAGGWTGCGTIEFKQFHQQHDGNARIGFGVKPSRGDF